MRLIRAGDLPQAPVAHGRESVMTELDKAPAWAEWFCALIRRRFAHHPQGPDAQRWRNWQFMVHQAQLAYRLSGDSKDLLDDYGFWRERDPELTSLGGE